MFVKLDKNNKIILSTIESIKKDDESFAYNSDYTWTDKEFIEEKIKSGLIPYYDKETDEIYYKEKIEEETEQTLSEIEQVILDTKLDTEYISCLLEMGLF